MNVSPRSVAVGRAAWGSALLVATNATLRLARVTPRPQLVAAARVLGARHLGEAACALVAPTPGVMRWSRRIDLLHAATMAPLALASTRLRTAATISLLASGLFAALDEGS